MRSRSLHRWDVSPTEAVGLQCELAARLDLTSPLGRCDLVAGADISYNRFRATCYASVVVWRSSDAAIVETQDVIGEMTFPYVPGLLSFREGPPLLQAFARLTIEPDVILFDGQGVAHPRRIGVAAHLGLWLDRPSVGCAKSRLCGQFVEPGPTAGSLSELVDNGEILGAVLRTKNQVKPLFVSPGHKIDRAGAVAAVQACLRGYRLPEPTRLAHLRVNALRQSASG